MKLNLPTGQSITIDFDELIPENFGYGDCIMCYKLTEFVQRTTETPYYYSFFTPQNEEAFKFFVPCDEENIFAMASTDEPPSRLDELIPHKGKNNITRALLKSNINVNKYHNGLTPIYTAVIHKNIDIINDLLDKGANIHAKCTGSTSAYDFCNQTKCVPGMKPIFDILSKHW
tara:strand:+ start:5399 stop:5917 length:519 start_codon:yes stop_codon:yes gene_type:complete